MSDAVAHVEHLPQGGVVHVSTPFLLLSMAPLLIIIFISYEMKLDLANPIITGAIRTFVQLSILGAILRPIFEMNNVYLVIGYCFLMIVLGAHAACRRTKYVFHRQFYRVLWALAVNVVLVGIFAFVVIIRPSPVWNPQYVIPIVGMLLGNSINGISLTMNNLTIALVEQQREIELYLSFGASSYEAISRLLREAVRSGTTPMLNSMAVIGIIAIPGMMTGQILGGSPVMEAARYQILIMYLIAVATFGVILMQAWIILKVGFDSKQMLQSDRFQKAPDRISLPGMVRAVFQYLSRRRATEDELKPLQYNAASENNYIEPKDKLHVQTSHDYDNSTHDNVLKLDGLTRSLTIQNEKDTEGFVTQTLFNDLSFTVAPEEITIIKGPSGCGKTQLLRSIAGLSPLDKGSITLDGHDWNTEDHKTNWRKRVRYVTQYKVDVPGSPSDFIERVTSFKSWRSDPNAPTEHEMINSTKYFVEQWGLKSDCLEKEWSLLSGGEAQRVIVALAIASKPSVLLLDEPTSALDATSKMAVQRSLESSAKDYGMKVLMITHDSKHTNGIGV